MQKLDLGREHVEERSPRGRKDREKQPSARREREDALHEAADEARGVPR